MTRARLGLPLLLLVACNPFAKKDTADAAPSATPVTAAVTTADAGAISASVDAGEETIWPAGTNQELRLTWAVYPPVGTGETAKRNLEIVARIGDVVKRTPLGAQQGFLFPEAQGVCNASRKIGNEVAEVTFYLGGENNVVAKRTKPDLLEFTSTIAPDVACKNCEKTTALGTLKIPADARIVEAFQDIPAPGKEAAFDCSPPTKIKLTGGEVTIDDLPNKGYFVKVDTKEVFQSKPTNPGPKPDVHWRVKSKAGFDDVLVFSQIPAKTGKGCTSYGFWFLGVKADGTFKRSRIVPWCGSATVRPKLESTAEKMTLSLPERPKSDGKGTVPAETWVFENGEAKKQ
jgi:hypothetical protein